MRAPQPIPPTTAARARTPLVVGVKEDFGPFEQLRRRNGLCDPRDVEQRPVGRVPERTIGPEAQDRVANGLRGTRVALGSRIDRPVERAALPPSIPSWPSATNERQLMSLLRFVDIFASLVVELTWFPREGRKDTPRTMSPATVFSSESRVPERDQRNRHRIKKDRTHKEV